MREIVFKAKRIDNGEWVYWNIFGELCRKSGKGTRLAIQKGATISYYDYIHQIRQFISIDTICRCTGLTDKNGKKIWENDVVEFEDTGEEGYEYKEGFDFINRAMVEFAEARWSLTDFASDNSGVMDEMYDHAEFMEFWQYCEVIGNVFDNPELLSE